MPSYCYLCDGEFTYRGRFHCPDCGPRERGMVAAAHAILTPREYTAASRLYGCTGQYMLRLATLTRETDTLVHHNQRRRRFRDGERPLIPDFDWNGYSSRPNFIDHPVLLSHLNGGFAVLSQVYGEPDGRGISLGVAPYGHGTQGELWPSSVFLFNFKGA